MKKVLVYLKSYWLTALLTPIAMIIEVLVDLLQPKLMSSIVDEGVLGGNMELILHTGLVMIALCVIGGIGGVGCGALAAFTSKRMGRDLRKDVFARVMHLSFQQTDQFSTGSLVTRLTNDCQMVEQTVAMTLRMFVRSLMMFMGGIFMCLSLSVNFGLVLAITLPLELVLVVFIIKKAFPLFGVVQKKLDRVNSVVQENVTGARVVKAYVREDYENDRFVTANDDLVNTSLRVWKLMSLMGPGFTIISGISLVAIIYIGGWQVQAATMQVGQVMAAITYVTQIMFGMIMVSMMGQQFTRALASAKRIQEVLDSDPAVASGSSKGGEKTGSVVLEHVSFRYPGAANRSVLKDISVEIKPGEHFAVLGATGSGKSSFINLIPRFYDVDEGAILVDGMNVKDYDLAALRSRIGMVMQKSELFSGTIADNIRWGNPEATDEEVIRAAKIAQADDFITGFAEGYNTIVGEKGSSLSGGQKQRLSIARAILKKPEVLIFDDSTSALDLGTESRLQAAMSENLQGVTVITIAQRVASVMRADRIAVLEHGRIAAIGTHEELLAASPVYQDIYDSQMRKEAEA